MTKEQEEIIERLERYLIADKSNIYTRVRVNDLETVLNMLKEKDKEIETLTWTIQGLRGLSNLIDIKQKELKEKDRSIRKTK